MKSDYIKYAIAVILAIAGTSLLSKYMHRDTNDGITIENSLSIIESTRPIGILYLYTAVTEDYVKGSFLGSGIGSSVLGKRNGLFKKKHDCVQIIQQQVSLTIDLDKVKYTLGENSDTVYVEMPDVEFTQSTLGSWFTSDDEDEEGAVQFDAKPMIKRAEQKIKNRYNTPENRSKAEAKARQTISDFLEQCGKTAAFK